MQFKEEELITLAALARDDLSMFPQLVSGNANPPHIHYIAQKIQYAISTPCERYKLLLISVPPRHGKSELISKHCPAWILGKMPKKRIILSSYASELVEGHSDTARMHFKKWGHILFRVEPSETNFKKVAWDTQFGGGLIAAGVGGQITGFGADIFIIDDYCKSYEDSESLIGRDNTWDWWQSVAATRLHPGAVVIILCTRWHEDDLIGRLLLQKEQIGKDFPFILEHINLPAIAESNDPLGRKPGESLWPQRYNKNQLNDIKTIVGPYFWSALYQGSPTSRGGSLFKSDNFRYYQTDANGDFLCYRKNQIEPLVVRKDSLTRHVYVDPSLETKKKNDPMGMQAWGYSSEHRIWLLLDRVLSQIDHTKVMEHILLFAIKNNCILIGIENEKIGKILIKQSEGNDSIDGRKIPMKEMPIKNLDKYTRAVPMATYMENQRVFFPKEASWKIEFEDNLTKFPRAKHNEDGDCTGMAQDMETFAPLSDSIDPPEYQRFLGRKVRDYRQSMGRFSSSRSLGFTGRFG